MHLVHRCRNSYIDLPLFTGKGFTLFVLFFTLMMEALIAEAHLPGTIRYLNDLFVFALLLAMLVRPGRTARAVGMPVVFIFFSLILIFTASAIINGVKMTLYFWALRNTFRGFVFFFACATYLSKEDLPIIFNRLLILQLISLVLALYQRFVLKLNMDHTGGIFGHGNGAGVNPFNALLFAYYLNVYLADKVCINKLVTATLSSLVIAAIAEEKFTFVIFVLITLVSILLTKASRKLTIALIVICVAVCVGMSVLQELSPVMFDILTSADAAENYLTSMDSGYKLPRVGSFAIINKLIFHHDLQKELFGIGFGNGEYSTFSFLVGPYYERFGNLQYRWFTHQWTFLECGYLGFFTYLAFFVALACSVYFARFKFDKSKRYLLTCGFALTISVTASIWYNCALKTDMCYISFFSLAVGFVAMKTVKKEPGYHVN